MRKTVLVLASAIATHPAFGQDMWGPPLGSFHCDVEKNRGYDLEEDRGFVWGSQQTGEKFDSITFEISLADEKVVIALPDLYPEPMILIGWGSSENEDRFVSFGGADGSGRLNESLSLVWSRTNVNQAALYGLFARCRKLD